MKKFYIIMLFLILLLSCRLDFKNICQIESDECPSDVSKEECAKAYKEALKKCNEQNS